SLILGSGPNLIEAAGEYIFKCCQTLTLFQDTSKEDRMDEMLCNGFSSAELQMQQLLINQKSHDHYACTNLHSARVKLHPLRLHRIISFFHRQCYSNSWSSFCNAIIEQHKMYRTCHILS